MENPVFWVSKQDTIEQTPVGDVNVIWGVIVINSHFEFPTIPSELKGIPLPYIMVTGVVEKR